MVTPELLETVLSYRKLKARLRSPQDRERVKKILNGAISLYSPTVVKNTARILDLTFMRLYDGLYFEESEKTSLKELGQRACVVLVPNHQSHADYIAISYALYKKHGSPVHVAGGDNLNIFPIGKYFRNCGCFFIRRSFAGDILYKLTIEAYLFYLLKSGEPLEFFFEGGRSRTGKLRPPRFGMFSMLMEVYNQYQQELGKPLVFVPVSIVHEYVPETRAHLKEIEGGQKVKERPTQLLKILKLFSYELGSIHIKVGAPIRYRPREDIKEASYDMAFRCYRQVGRQMMVTPTSLISLILLDEPSGTATWQQLYRQCEVALKFCRNFDVPCSKKLDPERAMKSIKKALNILIRNKKVSIIFNAKLKRDYYSIDAACRSELLYFKNTILHHFLVPYIISAAWVNVFNQRINTVEDLTAFLLQQRKLLKYEFYLPTVKELIQQGLKIVSQAVGRPIASFAEAMQLNSQELFLVISSVSVFSRAFNTIFESYFIAAATIKSFEGQEFSTDQFLKNSKEVFQLEKEHGRLIKYQESYSQPVLKSSLKYFESDGMISRSGGKFKLQSQKLVDSAMDKYAKHLLDLLTINLKLHES